MSKQKKRNIKKRGKGASKPRVGASRKNPNDATFRNINALKKRVAKLEWLMLAISEHPFFKGFI